MARGSNRARAASILGLKPHWKGSSDKPCMQLNCASSTQFPASLWRLPVRCQPIWLNFSARSPIPPRGTQPCPQRYQRHAAKACVLSRLPNRVFTYSNPGSAGRERPRAQTGMPILLALGAIASSQCRRRSLWAWRVLGKWNGMARVSRECLPAPPVALGPSFPTQAPQEY